MTYIRFTIRFVIIATVATVFGFAQYGYSALIDGPKVRREVVTVPQPDPTIDELLEEVPAKYGIPREVAEVLLIKEDARKERSAAVRREESPDWLARAKKITSDPDQIEMYRRSYGPLQVAGWHAAEFNMKWSDLIDIPTNFEVGCTVFSRGYKDAKTANPTNPVAALRDAFRRYNGSGPRAEVYANEAMKILQDRLLTAWIGKRTK